MNCYLDTGLCVILIILSALLSVVLVLLFYDFENVCEHSSLGSNLSTMVTIFISLKTDDKIPRVMLSVKEKLIKKIQSRETTESNMKQKMQF